MSNVLKLPAGLFMAMSLVSCAVRMPEVSVLPNKSGIECSSFSFVPEHNLRGGMSQNPDVPPAMVAKITHLKPIQTKAERYMIAPAGMLRVVSLEQPHRFPECESNRKELLQMMKDHGSHIGRYNRVPETPGANASQMFFGKSKVQEFPWGKGFVFLTTYINAKTGCLVNNDMLVLTLQGVTTDERFAVSGRFAIRHPKLPEDMHDKRGGPFVAFAIDDNRDRVRAEAWLDRQPDDSFQPSISCYMEMLSQLKIGAK